MKITVIGLGLIGGSMAVDLKRRHFADYVYGVESDVLHASVAKDMGLVDEIIPFEEGVAKADLVILAIPVGAAVDTLGKVLDIFAAHSPDGAEKCRKVVIDVCSTKENIVKSAGSHSFRKCFVASHPMAGTEYSGPWAAMSGLFDGRACILCNSGDSGEEAVRTVEALYDTLNMRVIHMDATTHDVHTAYVSHISHVTSFALALTVLEKEKNEKHIFDLASGGFSSTVRLATSNADMWVPIFSQNKDNVLQVIDTYLEKMRDFREAIAKDDKDGVRNLIESANRIKRILR